MFFTAFDISFLHYQIFAAPGFCQQCVVLKQEVLPEDLLEGERKKEGSVLQFYVWEQAVYKVCIFNVPCVVPASFQPLWKQIRDWSSQLCSKGFHFLTPADILWIIYSHCSTHYIPPKSLTLQGDCLTFLTLEQLIQRQDVGAKFTLWPLKPVAAISLTCRDSDNVINDTESLKMSNTQRLHFFLSICQALSRNL